VVSGMHLRKNSPATDGKELSPMVVNICAGYFNDLSIYQAGLNSRAV
jgi:hypothetical protein